jgi:hypothetical protein
MNHRSPATSIPSKNFESACTARRRPPEALRDPGLRHLPGVHAERKPARHRGRLRARLLPAQPDGRCDECEHRHWPLADALADFADRLSGGGGPWGLRKIQGRRRGNRGGQKPAGCVVPLNVYGLTFSQDFAIVKTAARGALAGFPRRLAFTVSAPAGPGWVRAWRKLGTSKRRYSTAGSGALAGHTKSLSVRFLGAGSPAIEKGWEGLGRRTTP